jgi:uroporphyrinogen decarboxylase
VNRLVRGDVPMTSRERVIAAIERKNLDRVPIDLGGTPASNILAKPYHGLLKRLHINKPVRVADCMQMWVYVDDEVSERFNTDVVSLWNLRDFLGVRRDRGAKDWVTATGVPVRISADFSPKTVEDGSYVYEVGGYVYRLPPEGFYFDVIKNAFSWVETVRDVEKIEYPIMDPEERRWLRDHAARLRKETDKFIVADIVGGWCDIAGPMLGNAKFYMDIITNKPMIHALFEKLNDVWMKRIDALVETVGDNIDAVIIYNDLGSNMAGLYKTETVKEMVIPYIREFYDHVRKVSRYYIVFHSCGSVYQYLPDLIDAGVRILNPVQVGTKDMEPEKLKQEFGQDLTFWGGAVDPQHALAFGSPKEVKEQVRRHTEIFKKNGGFIFTQPHNIQSNVPPENTHALYEAGNKYGAY